MDSSSDSLEPVELLADEFMERQRRGENPTIDEYVERHPDLADEIRDVFPALAVIERIAPASADLEQSQTSVESPAHVRVSQIGDYRILREIGRGGMGVVYEAEQQSLRRRVALKVLPRQFAGDGKALKRFQQEARAAARMHHTNIVPVFEVGDDDEHVYYAMQLIQGQGLDVVIEDLQRLRSEHSGAPAPKAGAPADRPHDLSVAASLAVGKFEQQDLVAEAQQPEPSRSEEYNATVIAETRLFDSGSTASAVLPGQSEISAAETDRNRYYRSVAQIGHQTAGALAYAHARGIIHRDIKPSNLLLDTAGVVWITDFGLAKTGDEALTHTGDILGTLRYMSPERFQGRCDVRADVYSLGLTLYEMLVLQPAFSSPDRLKLIELVSKSEPPTPRSIDPRIPRDLETIVLKSIDKDPRRRYPTAEDLADDLERFIQDEPIHARRISLAERFGRWSRRNKSLAASLVVVTTLLVVIALGSVLAAGHFRSLSTSLATTNESLETTLGELETQKGLAEQAATQNRDLAEDNRVKADAALAAQNAAEEAQETLQRELYVSDMLQARLAYQEGANDRLVELLTKHIPLEGETDQRGWEWYYWWRASRLYQQQIQIGEGPMRDMAAAPDGSWVAVRVWDQIVAILDSVTHARLATLRGCRWGDLDIELAVSPDGRLLAALGSDGDVKLWRTDDWSALPPIQPTPEPGRALIVVAFSSTGLLAVGDWWGRVTFWNAEENFMEGPPLETGQQLRCLAFSPDGGQLVTGDGVALNPDARGLLIWNLADRSERPLLEGESGITALHWTVHEGHSVIASGNVDGSVRLWDAETSVEFARMSAGGPVESMSFSSDGSRLAASTSRNNAVQIWETGSGRQIATMRGHSRKVSGVCFVGDNQTVWSSSEDKTLNVWNVSQSEPFMRLRAAVDPDRVRIITFGADSLSLWRYREPSSSELAREIHRWNTDTGQDLPAFDLGESRIAAFSNNGRFLAVVSRDAGGSFRLEIWRTDLAQPTQTRGEILPGALDNHVPVRLAVSDDGSTVAWTGNGKLVAINVDTGDYRIGDTGGDRLALSPDGSSLCVATFWTTQLWDIASDPPVIRSDLPGEGPVYNARFSRDGKYLAVAHWNNDVRVHDADTGELIHQFRGHAGSVFALDFSPDGRLLASGGFDGTVRLWDLDPDHPGLLLTLSAHETDVTSVAFSPDGRAIASISTDGDTRIWMGATDADLQQDAQYRTHRALANESRQAWEAAVAEWTAVIRLAPDVTHYERRGNLNLTLGRFNEARADFLKSLSLDIQNHFDWLSALATWVPLADLTQTGDQSWQYTLEEPAGDWQDPDYDDSGWESGGPRFETDSTGRDWPRHQIWLRREFVLSEPDTEQLAFLVYADDDVTIHVNGREAATAHWIATGWYQVVPSAVPFRTGRNVVAVHCTNSGGYQGAVHIIPGRRNSGETKISLLSSALEAEPENESLLQQRADLHVSLRQWDAAATDHIAILQLRSQAPDWTNTPDWNSRRSNYLPTLCADEDLFHALRRQLPDAPDLWLARARSLALRSNWNAAAEAYARYDGPRPVNSEIAFEIACVQRIVGDYEGYRETFNGLREQAGEDPTPFGAFTLARTAGLAAQEPDLAKQAVGWSQHAVNDARDPWRLHALGLALFRAGDHDGATEILQESLATGWSDNQNQAALALVRHDAGDEVQAQELLSTVRTWVAESKQQAVIGAVDVQVIDWLAVHALLSEADALIDGDEGETDR